MNVMRFFPLSLAAVTCSAAELPQPKFQSVTIDDKVQIGYGVAVADVDGDKKPDVILADKKQFVWYRNPGAEKAKEPGAWSKFILAENLTEKDNVCLAAQDLDGDGKCEIAVGAEWNPGDTVKSGAVFYLVPSTDRTQRWEAIKFPTVEPTTHRMRWMRLADGGSGLLVAPLHGRGNKNAAGEPVNVLLYRKPDDPRAVWKSETIDRSMHATHNFAITARLPEAGQQSGVILGGKEGLRSSRFDRESGKWTSTELIGADGGKEQTNGVGEIRLGATRDVPSFIATIEPMHGNALVVYTSEGGAIGEARPGKRVVLTDRLVDGHALACGDLLGAEADQVVVGWRGTPQNAGAIGVSLFAYDRGAWKEHAVDHGGMACEDLVLADMNGDGKVDVVASGRSTHNLKVYLNESVK
jgi:hypothetical protein